MAASAGYRRLTRWRIRPRALLIPALGGYRVRARRLVGSRWRGLALASEQRLLQLRHLGLQLRFPGLPGL
ncbi:MAG: hypothetical protein OXC19_21285 [Bryobacterales bacterium]|nr:hypothetical protein [Bryobacterales bacterium]